MEPTDLVSILIILGIVQGFMMTLLLLTTTANKKNINKWLIGILLFLIWTQIEFFLVRNKIKTDFVLLYGTRLGSWLVLGPMLFAYVRFAIGKPISSNIGHLVHFIPFLLITCIVPLVVPSLLPDRAIHYGILSLLKYYDLGTTPLQALYATIFIIQFLHLLTYIAVSNHLLSNYADELKRSHSNVDVINHRWLKDLLRLFIFILVGVTLFMSILFVFNIYEREFDYLYALPVAVGIYWMVFKVIRQPEIIRSSASNGVAEKYSKSSLKTEHAELYHDKIMDYMSTKKPYLNPNLKLADIAADLDIPIHHVSQVLNDQMRINFFDFVNQYRIEEAKERLSDKNGDTILQIAYAVGFNNKASFNKYFKKITGITPTQFVQRKLRVSA